MSDLLQKVSIANKTIMLMGNFNIDLLKYDTNADSRVFLDLVFLAYITDPTLVNTHSKRLIDNIFRTTLKMV